MPANTSPIFTLTPVIGAAVISGSNINLDGTGTVVSVLASGSNGTRISRITVQAVVTTTAGMVRLYVYTGSVYYLWKEIAVTAISKSATVAAFTYSLYLPGELALILPNGYSLIASTEKGEAFNIVAEGGNY
jgi:hypothetical protein